MGAPSKKLMHIRKLLQRKMELIVKGDKTIDIPEKEKIRVQVSVAGKRARNALQAQAQKARQNIQGGAKKQVRNFKRNVQRGINARKAEVINTAYNIYLRKQQWDV